MITHIKRLESGGIELQKRQHAPYSVVARCPECGKDETADLTDIYLSYPTTDVVTEVTFNHDEDDANQPYHEWQEFIVLRLTVEAAS